jgi:asparagine synthase (glutamine-hydrolysing)
MCGIFGIVSFSEEFSIHPNDWASASSNKVRGPDCTRTLELPKAYFRFDRLAIRGLSFGDDQPFIYEELSEKDKKVYIIMCNGEIYNCDQLAVGRSQYACDIKYIYPLWKSLGYDFAALNARLVGEYALSIVELQLQNDSYKVKKVYLSTDPHSVRPIFTAYDNTTKMLYWSSLVQGFKHFGQESIKIHRLEGCQMLVYDDTGALQIDKKYRAPNFVNLGIRITDTNKFRIVSDTFIRSVQKRLVSDRPLGALLSGGLDSSLVCSIAQKELGMNSKPALRTFAAGMVGSPDLKYARMVADYIGSNHTEIIFTPQQALDLIPDVIQVTGSYDITSIRASICQYIAAQWIAQNTDIKVLLLGDGSDELLCGYKYFARAPNVKDAISDRDRILREIHLYDGLRADRTVAGNGLEARLPFLDPIFTSLMCLPIWDSLLGKPPRGIEKYVLRQAFSDFGLLPNEVLWRSKVALSDGVSMQGEKSWFEIIREHCSKVLLPTLEVSNFEHCQPISPESLVYRILWAQNFADSKKFEHLIPHFWMPSWSPETNDPSARTLNGYQEN